ncbi:hypothetical protein Harman_33770 [Haloarcula mannanilytica]|uniref:Uncharacterized protein n=1 Tax=Haloarcula mannanilytica TaxID=2509225 RepID=A0A4C2EMA7_9EURY|nr:hypothetical protein [Haloarcula mannanilytica]GCF15442.1 hypothetical protein Harman_33770 [Haloarcula mannanilytica]
MPADRPFVDPATGELEPNQIMSEVIPLAKLIGVFVGGAFLPYGFAFFGSDSSALGVVLTLIGEFVLAVGAGVVLIYVIARGIRLAEV